MEDILTVFKASKYCNVSPKTIINWIESGHISAYKTVGGHRRIEKANLVAFMTKQGIPIPEDAPVEVKWTPCQNQFLRKPTESPIYWAFFLLTHRIDSITLKSRKQCHLILLTGEGGGEKTIRVFPAFNGYF